MIEIVTAHTANADSTIAVFRALCVEYAAELPFVAVSLQHQGFDHELATLPGKYASPKGVILLARDGASDAWLGCVAVRPLDEPGTCELKRMYVRPVGRGRGIGRALAARAVEFAAAAGYGVMRLDTDASMHAAIAVYRGLGFVETPPYNTDPCPDTRWFALDLRGPDRTPARP